MSKLTKLINNPSLFFRDFFDKRLSNKKDSASSQKSKSAKNVAPKAPAKALNFDISSVNIYRSYKIMLQSGEGLAGGLNHLQLWLPIFLKAKVDFILLIRNEALFKQVKKEYPYLSIAHARRLEDVEQLISLLPSLKYVFYPSSTGNNIHLTRFNHLHHVFIGHGDSDKAASAHKALRLYDEIWTAGQAHIDRFKNNNFDTKHLTFLKVGRPNLYSILNYTTDNWKDRMPISALYLPTWEGVMEEANYSSLHIAGNIMDLIQEELDIPLSVKFHPFTGNRSPEFKKATMMTKDLSMEEGLNITAFDSSVTVDSIIPKNNIFICDISAVVTECLAANAPIFVFIPSDRNININSSNMTYSDYCYTFSSINELKEKLKEVLAGNDYLADRRSEAMDYFIGKSETLDQVFIKQLSNISKSKSLSYTPRYFDYI